MRFPLALNKLSGEKNNYISSIKKLFPKGQYWDAQFDNPESDLSVWAEASAGEVLNFKSRFDGLIKESAPKTAETTIEDWERVLLGTVNSHLSDELRRNLLLKRRQGFISVSILKDIANLYTAELKRIYYPYRSAFFGQTRIAINRICSPASFSVLFIEVKIKNEELKADLERTITDSLLANMIIYFIYE